MMIEQTRRGGLLLLVFLAGVAVEPGHAAPRGGKNAKLTKARIPANIEALPVTRRDRELQNLRLSPAKSRTSARLRSEALDQLLVEQFIQEGMTHAREKAPDDVLFRRMHLALVGKKPSVDEITHYLEDTSEDKKSRLIDELLDRYEFGMNQAHYWYDVIDYRRAEGLFTGPTEHFKRWLADNFNNNVPWAQTVGEMLTAEGINDEKPATFFIVTHDADPVQLAGETSRIFLGIQIQCAECHDHPSDTWKRQQFHELAAFFARARIKGRPDLESKQRPFVREVFQAKNTYMMPDLQDPSSKGTEIEPVFLSGQAVPDPELATDAERRLVLGRLLTSQRNEYFARAFVNRVWAQLFGYGFTNPVDNIGMNVPVAYPEVFNALANSFIATGYDVKELYRVILNTKTFERRFLELDGSFGEGIMFSAIQPVQLSADQIHDNTEAVLGRLAPAKKNGLRDEFREAFGFDPSANLEELEGGILQPLLLMNNKAIHERLDATDRKNFLNYLLAEYSDDPKAIEMLYMNVLARKPVEAEREHCMQHLKETANRNEAFEDLLWCLLNTTEFLRKQ